MENSQAIAQTIADASVDIILNRDLSSLQSLIDQFIEIQGISYIYIVNDTGEFLAHTFVPGIPEEMYEQDTQAGSVERSIEGMGDFVEVSSQILAGHVGSVHIGMDVSYVTLAIQKAIGKQVYLIAGIFFVSIFSAIWFVSFASRPLTALLGYAVNLAKRESVDDVEDTILERDDEVGHLARLFQYYSQVTDESKVGTEPDPVAQS